MSPTIINKLMEEASLYMAKRCIGTTKASILLSFQSSNIEGVSHSISYPLSTQCLLSTCQTSDANMSQTIKRMKRDGLIETFRRDDHTLNRMANLTDKGRALVESIIAETFKQEAVA